MIAFDADVLTEILAGTPVFVERATQVPVAEQSVTIVVIEEILRGRLNAIRQAESGRSKLKIERAYELFHETLNSFREVAILGYSEEAEALYHQWRSQRIRVGTHDLRIAAICVVHSAKLITRNRRDFERVPDLSFDIWS